MDRTEKESLVSELKQIFSDAGIVVLTHYKGLTVASLTELRFKMKEAEAGFKVVKNRLVKIALKGTPYEGMTDKFTGPIAMAWSADPLVAPKVTYEFSKSNALLNIVGGAMKENILDTAGILVWATLPTLDEARGKLVGLLQAPAAQMARLMNAYGTKEQ